MQILRRSGRWFGSRRAWLLGCFLVLSLLAGVEWAQRTAHAADDEAVAVNGTLPPGGTIPPGTIPPGGTVPPAIAGQIRVIHFAPFDSNIAATVVDICTEDNQPIAGFTNLVYRSETGYQNFVPGTYDWKVTLPGCGATVVDIPPFTLFKGAMLTLNIIGDGVSQPLTTILAVDDLGFPFSLYLPNVRFRA